MKILVAGDFCPQERVAGAFEHDKFEDVLGEVKHVLEGVDYSIVNFESAVTFNNRLMELNKTITDQEALRLESCRRKIIFAVSPIGIT